MAGLSHNKPVSVGKSRNTYGAQGQRKTNAEQQINIISVQSRVMHLNVEGFNGVICN